MPAAARRPRSPGRSVSRAATQPAGARLGDGDRQAAARAAAHATCSSIVRAVVGEQRVGVALAHDILEGARRPRPPRGSIARHDLELAAAHAGRDLDPLERRRPPPRPPRSVVGDLRLRQPVEAQHRAARRRCAPRIACANASVSMAALPHRLQLARRPGQHDHGRAVATLGRRDDERRRGADRREHGRAPRGTTACLRLEARIASSVSVRPAAAQRQQDRGDPLLERLVEHHLAPAELADDGRP